MVKQQEKPLARGKKVIFWGLAAGRRSTKEAAAGALAWREYPDRSAIPREDWQVIIAIRSA
jgi:hypothetical protein